MIVFLSLVSRDLVHEFYRRPQPTSLFTSLTPSLLMMLVLILAWQRPKLGAVVLILLAAGWAMISSHHPELATAIGVPLLVNALLYWIGPGHTAVTD